MRKLVLKALGNVLQFPKQPKELKEAEDEFKFLLDDKFLSAKGPLSSEDKELIREEIGRYDDILDLLDDMQNQKDEASILNLWDNYVDQIENRIKESQKRA